VGFRSALWDFVVLYCLCDRENGGIESWRVFVPLHDGLALFHDAHDGVASFSLGLHVNKSEYLLKAFDLSLSFSSVFLGGVL
jgi:hypothetical protein